MLRPKPRQSEDIDEGYEEKEIDKQVKSWDRQIGQWVFDGIKPGYSPQTERALRSSPEVRVPISKDVYEMAQNSPKCESWRRSLNKYTPGRFIAEYRKEDGKGDKVTQEEPVFPVMFDDDDDVKKVSKVRRSKSFHAKHTVTIPSRPSSASSVPTRTSADSSAVSPLAKVIAKPRPHSAVTAPVHNASGSPVRSATPTTTLQNTITPTGSPVRAATPTKDSVTAPTVVKKPQTTANASSITPPVAGTLIQEKAKLFGTTTRVKRSQSLLAKNYQKPVKYLQRDDQFVPAANNSPPATNPLATIPPEINNTASPRAVVQNNSTTDPPVSGRAGHSPVKEPAIPVGIPWQAAMIDGEGIPWQARVAGNSFK